MGTRLDMGMRLYFHIASCDKAWEWGSLTPRHTSCRCENAVATTLTMEEEAGIPMSKLKWGVLTSDPMMLSWDNISMPTKVMTKFVVKCGACWMAFLSWLYISQRTNSSRLLGCSYANGLGTSTCYYITGDSVGHWITPCDLACRQWYKQLRPTSSAHNCLAAPRASVDY